MDHASRGYPEQARLLHVESICSAPPKDVASLTMRTRVAVAEIKTWSKGCSMRVCGVDLLVTRGSQLLM